MTAKALWLFSAMAGRLAPLTPYSTGFCLVVILLGAFSRAFRDFGQALSLWLRAPLAIYAWALGMAVVLASLGWVGLFLYLSFLPTGAIGASLAAAVLSWLRGPDGQASDIVINVTAPLVVMSVGTWYLTIRIARDQNSQSAFSEVEQ